MKGGTLFSGIGAPELAMPGIDWRWCAETDPFASAVLAQRFPHVPNLGDVTKADWDAAEPVDVVVFGSPCQSFSVAGKRAGLDDPRGNMALVGLQIVDRARPRWVVWENVPGVLSSDEWRDFGAFLGALGQCGYGFAYRVLDAQHFGIPQRRRRVFVVGHLGDWRPAAAVLFEPESLRWNPPPRREAGEGVAPSLSGGSGGGCGPQYRQKGNEDALVAKFLCGSDGGIDREDRHTLIAYGGNNTAGPIEVATAVRCGSSGANGHYDFESETFVACGRLGDVAATLQAAVGGNGNAGNGSQMIVTHSLRADGFDASEDGTGRGTPIVPVMAAGAHGANGAGIGVSGDPMFTLDQTGAHAVAFRENIRGEVEFVEGGVTQALSAGGGKPGQGYPAIAFHARQDPDSGPVTHQLDTDDCSIAVAVPIAFNKGEAAHGDIAPTLQQPSPSGGGQPTAVMSGMSVRRLTPVECERLQGFPDDFTLIPYRGKPAADGPRYRALGNAMAVPVVRWVLRRLSATEAEAAP